MLINPMMAALIVVAPLGDAAPQAEPTLAAPAGESSKGEATRQPGLWIGTMRVCGGGIERVDLVPFEPQGEAIVLTFTSAFRERLAAETARLVGRRMPILLDGRLIMDPHVNEPITGGQVQLIGSTREEAELIRRAATRPC